MEITSVASIDDSANTNKMFFGGQDVNPSKLLGDLYTESDCIIAHQAWVQRALTPEEISGYDGTFNTGNPDLYFKRQRINKLLAHNMLHWAHSDFSVDSLRFPAGSSRTREALA
jgi:hypothetical protein